MKLAHEVQSSIKTFLDESLCKVLSVFSIFNFDVDFTFSLNFNDVARYNLTLTTVAAHDLTGQSVVVDVENRDLGHAMD